MGTNLWNLWYNVHSLPENDLLEFIVGRIATGAHTMLVQVFLHGGGQDTGDGRLAVQVFQTNVGALKIQFNVKSLILQLRTNSIMLFDISNGVLMVWVGNCNEHKKIFGRGIKPPFSPELDRFVYHKIVLLLQFYLL